MVMQKSVKKKWLKALRSGEYKQGSGQLRSDDRYCCLGVLCDITGHLKPRSFDWMNDFPDMDYRCNDDDAIREFKGLSAATQKTLAHLNDNGSSFKEIAAYISRNVKAK